jgi:DNA-binding MarR family transcriptional regulator
VSDPKAFEELINELRLSLHRVTQVAEQLHAEEPISIGMRAVLEFLQKNSDSTVPAIAQSRHVSRQLIQTLVNALLEQELVALVDNPIHRRSPLVSLTREGEKMLQRMRRREHRYFEALPSSVSSARIIAATKTLRAIRGELAGDES